MTGFLAIFAIAAAGTALGLIIARFSSTQDKAAKSIQELAEQQRQLQSAFEQQAREIRERLDKEKASSQQSVLHF